VAIINAFVRDPRRFHRTARRMPGEPRQPHRKCRKKEDTAGAAKPDCSILKKQQTDSETANTKRHSTIFQQEKKNQYELKRYARHQRRRRAG